MEDFAIRGERDGLDLEHAFRALGDDELDRLFAAQGLLDVEQGDLDAGPLAVLIELQRERRDLRERLRGDRRGSIVSPPSTEYSKLESCWAPASWRSMPGGMIAIRGAARTRRPRTERVESAFNMAFVPFAKARWPSKR